MFIQHTTLTDSSVGEHVFTVLGRSFLLAVTAMINVPVQHLCSVTDVKVILSDVSFFIRLSLYKCNSYY